MKIMFVCTGNICRSPLAHAMLEKKLRDCGFEKFIAVESSGLTAYHVGEQADSRMRATARKHGITIDHLSMRFMPSDLEAYDYIFAMDQGHYDDMRRMAKDNSQREKVQLFRDYDPEITGPADVPDPYYGGQKGFENVYDIVERTCENIIKSLISDEVSVS